MGKIKQYEIQLDDSQLVYSPGQTINGKVVIQLSEDLSVKGIRIKCRGKSYVAWKQGKNNYHFNGENYIYEDKPLYGTDHGSVTLRAGSHSYPFQFALPYGLPSSFERPKASVDCHVRYWLKTFMDGARDEYKLAITVAAPLDLNTIQNIMIPSEMSSTKDVCCLCCRSGPITARLRVPRVGFVPGDTVNVEAEVDDNTGRGTNSADIKLVMITRSHSSDGSSQYPFSSTMVKASRGPLSPGGSDSWVGQLVIPPTPVSGLPGCGIIDLEHHIVLSVNVRKTPMNLDVSIPVVIGTIPYNDGAHDRPAVGYSGVSGGIRSEEIVARI